MVGSLQDFAVLTEFFAVAEICPETHGIGILADNLEFNGMHLFISEPLLQVFDQHGTYLPVAEGFINENMGDDAYCIASKVIREEFYHPMGKCDNLIT